MAHSAKQLTKIRQQARYYAYKYGLKDYYQDFASFVTIRLLEGSRASFKHMIVDFRREYFGDSRTHVGRLTQVERKAYLELHSSYDDEGHGFVSEADKNTHHSWIRQRPNVPDDNYTTACVTKVREMGLTKHRRTVFLLINLYGLTQREVALILGVNESRVSQIMADISRNAHLSNHEE
jgi:hypothetical protein